MSPEGVNDRIPRSGKRATLPIRAAIRNVYQAVIDGNNALLDHGCPLRFRLFGDNNAKAR
jgi:hypothetical protein